MAIDIAAKIIKYKKSIFFTFIALMILSAIAQVGVSVNYNVADYLPEDAQSTKAMDIMDEEFDGAVPNTNVMMKDITIQEALQFKEQLEAIDGVSDVTWLDDAVDLKQPLEMANEETVESYYQNGNALFNFTIREGDEVAVTDEIYELIGEENAMAGEALDTATQQKMAFSETMFAAALLIPTIIIILILSTNSWAEPILLFDRDRCVSLDQYGDKYFHRRNFICHIISGTDTATRRFTGLCNFFTP